MMMLLVVVPVRGSKLDIGLVGKVRVPLLLSLLKLNAGGFFDLKHGQSGQTQWDFLEHYIININISKLIIILMTFIFQYG